MSIVKTGQKGVTVYDPTKACNGYTLFCTLGAKDCWLIDMEGRFVQWWRMPSIPGAHGLLLPNGNLLYAGRTKSAEELGIPVEIGSLGGMLFEIDWDSNIVWKAEVPYQGHDFTPMPNGHIMYIGMEPKGILPDEIAAKVKGGVLGTEEKGKIWGDTVVEIDRNGNRIWEWLAYEHLDPEIDVIGVLDSRNSWPYINSVQVCCDGSVLLNSRKLSQVFRIDYKTGEVIGRYGRKCKISHPHDARELDNGNITVFDNGSDRHEYEAEYSRAVEFNPRTDEIIWEYKADPPSDFYSAHSGGCERQPNGNTVIVETDKGRIFEVTRNCEIVWEYVNPQYIVYFMGVTIGKLCNMAWRAHRYPCDYPGLDGKDLDPGKFYWLNRIWGPDAFAKDIKPCIF